jgi:hypothetical protein
LESVSDLDQKPSENSKKSEPEKAIGDGQIGWLPEKN